MIQSFKCQKTELLFKSGKTRHFAAFQAVAERKLQMLDSASTLDFLKSPPGNRLEALTGDRVGHAQHPHQCSMADLFRLDGTGTLERRDR